MNLSRPPGIPDSTWNALHSDDNDERIAGLLACVVQLYSLLVEEAPPSSSVRKKVPRGLEMSATRFTSFKARVGRAASRMGLSMDEFVRRYGWVDRVPRDRAG